MKINSLVPMPDGGIRYTETDISKTFPEPFNTFSSALFIALAIYWLIRLYQERKDLPVFLLVCTIILLTGSIGGTLYHGLRRYRLFLFMDYMPIMILCLLSGFYFLGRVMRKWYYAFVVLAFYMASMIALKLIFGSQGRNLMININYGMLALLVLVPTLLFLAKHNWKGGRLVALALASFLIALWFRVLDPLKVLPMGTHFLWHLFGALATACMFSFLHHAGRFNDRAGIPQDQAILPLN